MSDAAADVSGAPAVSSHYRLHLYVTGATARSTRAIANLRRLCESELAGCYDLEIIDIYKDPAAARDAQIIAAPTLVKSLPEPERRIIGDLGDEARVRRGLNLGDGSPSRAGRAD